MNKVQVLKRSANGDLSFVDVYGETALNYQDYIVGDLSYTFLNIDDKYFGIYYSKNAKEQNQPHNLDLVRHIPIPLSVKDLPTLSEQVFGDVLFVFPDELLSLSINDLNFIQSNIKDDKLFIQ